MIEALYDLPDLPEGQEFYLSMATSPFLKICVDL
jgi:hypothetical protein